MTETPELFSSRFFSQELLLSGEVVPVGISYEPPIVPLSYELEHHLPLLAPESYMLRGSLAEWRPFCYAYWRYLDGVGVERIHEELAAISERHGGKPLCLLDYEDVLLGHRSHRLIFARWWQERTGNPVYELTNDGQKLHYSQVHRQAKPKRPKDRDPRWREAPRFEWPLTHEEVTRWLSSRHWQQARSTENPHSYTRRDWGPERLFELVILHARECGDQEHFAGVEYTYLSAEYDGAAYKHWTMGDGLAQTVILNRKQIAQDEAAGDEPSFGGLFDQEGGIR